MAVLYTEKDIAKILKELRIAPVDGKIDGNEAAKILMWRAKDEFGVERIYNSNALRQQVKSGNFPSGSIDDSNKRRNLYAVQAVFQLPISPNRGVPKKELTTPSYPCEG